ncbi:MAG: alpha-L-fucosidase, partial [Kiritimatiellae bacterium]|nr:alpha-L-fucosidase [Kiritimatiellia bacterium]
EKYIQYLKAQVTELCTNYGTVKHFFWDINVPEHYDPSINQMIKTLQPGIVINDRGFDDGDFGTPERNYNQEETDAKDFFEYPTEACNSVGTLSWGYRKDEDYYTTSFLAESIDKMMSKGANFLLNIGPNSSGQIPSKAIVILEELGNWYNKVKESFIDTTFASELTSNKDIILTKRENTIYVHIPQPMQSNAILLPPISQLPESATLLNTGETIQTSNAVLPTFWEENRNILRLKNIPTNMSSNCPLVIKLEFADLSSLTTAKNAVAFEG